MVPFLGQEVSMKRVSIYLRVSTDKQTTNNQRRELEAVAKRSGWEVVKVYQDAGISGAKGKDQRPGLDAMMKAVNAKEFDMVATWRRRNMSRYLDIQTRGLRHGLSMCIGFIAGLISDALICGDSLTRLVQDRTNLHLAPR